VGGLLVKYMLFDSYF